MIFGRHDLVQDAPISRVDLLLCRNTLMYFNAETQARILRPLPLRAATDAASCSSASPRCCITHGDLFAPVDLKRRDLPQGRRGRRCATGCRHGRRRRRRAPTPATLPATLRERRVRRRRRSRSSSSTRDGTLVLRQRSRRAALFGARRAPTSAGRSRTSSSPTGRSSCARALDEALARAPRRAARRRRVERPAAASAACFDVQVDRRWSTPTASSLGASDHLHRRHARRAARRTSSSAPSASSRRPTRSCSRRSRSSRPPTRSSSRPTRSSRRPTRSSSRPTRSSRR